MTNTFDKWAILELMGHRRIAGKVSEVELFGAKMCKIIVPQPEGRPDFEQYYGGSAIYCVTPCSEETARDMASYVSSPDYRPQLPPMSTLDDGGSDTCMDCGADCAVGSSYCESCAEAETTS